jgi:hypothetical protein
LQDEKVPAITGTASVFAIFVQSTGDVCRRQGRLRVTDAGWKAATPFWARFEPHRRSNRFTVSVAWGSREAPGIFLQDQLILPARIVIDMATLLVVLAEFTRERFHGNCLRDVFPKATLLVLILREKTPNSRPVTRK